MNMVSKQVMKMLLVAALGVSFVTVQGEIFEWDEHTKRFIPHRSLRERTYSDCLRLSNLSRTFTCDDKQRGDFILQEHVRKYADPPCPSKELIFVGDSFMWELLNAVSCMCPRNTFYMYGGSHTYSPTRATFEGHKIIREHGKKFHPDSILVLSNGILRFDMLNKAYLKPFSRFKREIRRLRYELHELNVETFPAVIYVQNTAQHFCTEDGTYARGLTEKRCCDVHNHNIMWQEYAMKNLIIPLNISSFDGFEVTKKWFNSHPGIVSSYGRFKRVGGDCLHLCSEERGPLISFGLIFLSFISNLERLVIST